MVDEGAGPPEAGATVVFRFHGFGGLPGPELELPLLPVRLSGARGAKHELMNAVIDSGSHRTIVPFEVAEEMGLTELRFDERVETPVGPMRTAPATLTVEVVDSHLPTVVYWTVEKLPVEVADPSTVLPLPLLGWDLLRRFEVCLHRDEGLILMRPSESWA